MSRPELSKNISLKDFKNYYWLKEELVNLCKSHNLPASGGKIEIKDRISEFLKTGKILQPIAKFTSNSSAKEEIPTLDTVITKNYRNSETNREFFKQVIGSSFKFNVQFMNFFKNNVGKTYKDAVEEYYRIEKSKKDGTFKTDIGKQFEYNQYFRDFFSDPINKDKSRKEAIKCWNYKKSLPQVRKYERGELECLNK